MSLNKPKVGLALGSGSARGWAHIGVIQELRELGVNIDIVAGTSIGALVGASYCLDQVDELGNWVQQLRFRDVVGFMDVTFRGGGFVQGNKLYGYFQEKMGERVIEEMPKQFACVSTDLENGREVWFREGPLIPAIRASSAVPGLFSPMKVNDRWLLDGGLVNPVPVSLCRAMGADIVIAVNLNSEIVGKHLRKSLAQKRPESKVVKKSEKAAEKNLDAADESFLDRLAAYFASDASNQEYSDAPGVMEVMASAINIMQDRVTRSRMAGDPPDVILAPRLAHLALMEFHRAGEAIEEGKACVRNSLAPLQQLGLVSSGWELVEDDEDWIV